LRKRASIAAFCASTVEHAPVLDLLKPQVGVVIASFEGRTFIGSRHEQSPEMFEREAASLCK
jgi:hypothetical protein